MRFRYGFETFESLVQQRQGLFRAADDYQYLTQLIKSHRQIIIGAGIGPLASRLGPLQQLLRTLQRFTQLPAGELLLDLGLLRLELRVVPSGPTLIDTIANTVFYVGLTEGLKTLGDQLTEVPFATLESDFYRAAREGLDTSVHWPDGQELPLKQILLERALPLAREALQAAGIEDCERWLDIIEARVKTGATGADWISRHWKQFGDSAQLVCDYIAQASTNRPVHQWQDPGT